MDIYDVGDTILKWARSCNTIEQLEGLEKSGPEIIDTLFGKTETTVVIAATKDMLYHEIKERKLFINHKHLQP